MRQWMLGVLVLAGACADVAHGPPGDDASSSGEPGELTRVPGTQLHDDVGDLPPEERDTAAIGALDDGATSKKVIGNVDSRTPVVNSKVAPYAAVVQLLAEFPEYVELCTGTLIAHDAVLTAAHCIVDRETGDYATATRVVPATYPDAQGEEVMPFGKSYAVHGHVPDGWKTAGDAWAARQFDYGVVRLKHPLGVKAGLRKFASMAGPLEGRAVKLVAYHGDKFIVGKRSGLEAYIMQESTDVVRKSYNGLINHYADSEVGSSGGPLVSDGVHANTVFAVHIAGPKSKDGHRFNVAVALDANKIANIQRWLAR